MRLGISDRQVIHAFTSGRSRKGTGKLSTDGVRLDGHWMGGSNIASWTHGKIVFHDLGSKAAQTVQNYVRRSAAPNDLASRSATRPRKMASWTGTPKPRKASSWNAEDKIAEAMAVRGQVANDMLPLFDHLLNLARSDSEPGAYPYQRQRAGRYIAKAKGFAKKYPRTSGDRSRRKKSAKTARRAYRISGRRRLSKDAKRHVKRASRGGKRASYSPATTAAARKRGWNYGRDPGGPGKFIVKISNAPRYKGEYSGGATLAEAVVEARTFKATVGPRARIQVGYFTFGKNDPEDGRWHVSRTVQQGETSWL